jgi:hypothetical protein
MFDDTPKARRTDGTDYTPTHPQFRGNGFMRSCAKCAKFKPQGLGWKKRPIGMCCPECVK